MLKFYQSPKWKKHSEKRSLKERKRKKVKKERKKNQTKTSTSRRIKPKNKHKYTNLEAPKNFSIINNYNEVIAYLHKVKKTIHNREQPCIDLKNIKKLTPDAIAFLLCNIKEYDFHRDMKIRGFLPENLKLAKIFEESGFQKYVTSEIKEESSSDKNTLMHKLKNKKVDNENAKLACQKAVKYTLKSEIKFQPIYEILIECMANTHNHANIENEGHYDWWLFQHHDPESCKTIFSFIDSGVGIFNSLPVKNFKRKFMEKTGITDNTALVPRLLSGEIKSRTGLKERGKGLPLIYDHSKNEQIGEFKIIANDVYADLKTGKNFKMQHKFKGSLLYFELWPEEKNE